MNRATLLCWSTLALLVSAQAQTALWTSALRGSWVQTGTAAQGDVTLTSAGAVCQIVVADDERPSSCALSGGRH